MPHPTHVFVDFFGTLVAYAPGVRGEDHRGSHRLLTDAGCALAYEDYLAAWTQVFDEAERAASASLDVSRADLKTALKQAERIVAFARDVMDRVPRASSA